MKGSERKTQKQRRFSAKMTRAVDAVLRSRTLGEAAQVAGLSESTLRRLREQPEFVDALTEAQTEIFSRTCNAIRALATDATATLARVMRDEKALPAARTRAAGLVLALVLRTHRLEAHENRLARVEAILKKREVGR